MAAMASGVLALPLVPRLLIEVCWHFLFRPGGRNKRYQQSSINSQGTDKPRHPCQTSAQLGFAPLNPTYEAVCQASG